MKFFLYLAVGVAALVLLIGYMVSQIKPIQYGPDWNSVYSQSDSR
jgi:hypothetical protein